MQDKIDIWIFGSRRITFEVINNEMFLFIEPVYTDDRWFETYEIKCFGYTDGLRKVADEIDKANEGYVL